MPASQCQNDSKVLVVWLQGRYNYTAVEMIYIRQSLTYREKSSLTETGIMPTRPLPLQETACPCISHLTLLDRSERKYSASFFLSDNVQNKKASRGKTLYLQTTGTCFVKIYSVCKRLCVFWFMLCAEWLHSSVHGSPGESPGGGAVPSGEQRQPEYRH